MGIFDRLRFAGQTLANNDKKAGTAEQDAIRLIEKGQTLEAAGRFGDALQCYQDAIQLMPDLARAHFSHGNILLIMGDWEGALDALATAVGHNPDYAETFFNMGNALLEYGQLGGAVASYRRLLAIRPDFVEAHNNLGNTLQDLGQYDDAVSSYLHALEINPDFADAHCNMGLALQALGEPERAIESYMRALQINPALAEAHNNLGNAFKDIGQLESAVASYHRALDIQPNFTEAHNNLGYALQNLGRLNDAVKSYLRALELKPGYAEALCNLGNAQQGLGQFDGAIASYLRALEINPQLAGAHSNLGVVLKDLGQFNNAIAGYRRALALKPDFAEAHNNLGLVLQDLGQFDAAETSYRQALEVKPDYHEAHSNLLLALNYTASYTLAYYLEQARQYGRIVAGKVSTRFSAWQCAAHPERLRVGLVSGDLRKHSVGHFLEGLLTHIDPARIELIAYPTYHKEDELTARIRRCFSAWKPLYGLSDQAAARLIHADGVHVLIDLSGHTEHNRLPVFAWKPAPVQVTWLGLPATSGVAEMDYVLGDPHAIPVEFDDHFSEAVWRMPDSCLCLTVPVSAVKVAPLPALAAGYVTFGSFNNLTKMTDAVVAVWARILKSVPNSQLLLKTKQLDDLLVCEKTRQHFASCGMTSDRLLLGGRIASDGDHLAAYNKIDIALDTFPYPGVTTSVEALWMGVPVLSLRGDRFLSCTAGSIARNAGLPDWVAADEDDYVAKAITFASDLPKLAALRAGLRQQVLASPLFDAPRFARNFEDALWGMWQRFQDQQETS